jgi:TolA-binding protein
LGASIFLLAQLTACTQAVRTPDPVSLNLQQDMRELVSAQKSLTARIQMVAERMSLLEDRLAVQEANLRVPLPTLPVVKLVAEHKPRIVETPPEPTAAITQADVASTPQIPVIPTARIRAKRPQRKRVRVRSLPVVKKTAQPKPSATDPSSILSKGTRLVNQKQFNAAIELMGQFKRDFDTSEFAEYALLIEGRAYFESGRVAQAIRIFGDLIEQFPNGATVPDALYMVGLSQDRLGNTSRAVETLARLKTIYPATEAGKRAAEALSGRPQSL